MMYNYVTQAIFLLLEVLHVLAQEGEWTKWSQWSGCSVTCGYGVQKRQKTWQPRVTGSGVEEPFKYEDIIECITNVPCPRDGVWGYWGAWSECTKMCDGGTTKRMRECNSPSPENGGKDCEGKEFAETTCNDWKCPELPPNFDMSQCNETTYMCLDSRQCVPTPRRCDNQLHCHDGSDEHNCAYYWPNKASRICASELMRWLLALTLVKILRQLVS
ncbi:thrombospondin-1-like [Dreissena polymorpha]|nr:thrombospondin-1-like [Dreissena polymorpha]